MVKEGWRIGVLRLLATLMLLPGAPWGLSSISAGVGLQGLQSYLLQGFNKPPEPLLPPTSLCSGLPCVLMEMLQVSVCVKPSSTTYM